MFSEYRNTSWCFHVQNFKVLILKALWAGFPVSLIANPDHLKDYFLLYKSAIMVFEVKGKLWTPIT